MSIFWVASKSGALSLGFGWLRILCKCSYHLLRLSSTWDNLTALSSLTVMFLLLYPTAKVSTVIYGIFSSSLFWIQGSPLLLLSLHCPILESVKVGLHRFFLADLEAVSELKLKCCIGLWNLVFCSLMVSVAISSWWSLQISTPLCTYLPKCEFFHLALMIMRSIWVCVLPSGDVQIILQICLWCNRLLQMEIA